MFHYEQDSFQQQWAAQQLKKLNWKFHRKYKTWFKKMEGPDEKYVYFDYDNQWKVKDCSNKEELERTAFEQ